MLSVDGALLRDKFLREFDFVSAANEKFELTSFLLLTCDAFLAFLTLFFFHTRHRNF